MVLTLTLQSSRGSPRFDEGNHRHERRDSKDDGIEIRWSRQTYSMGGEERYHRRGVQDQYHHSYGGDYGKRRSRYDDKRTHGMFCSPRFLQCLLFFLLNRDQESGSFAN